MFSHGRGSNPLSYAWFAETLASHGYIVAGLYHFRANTYDQTVAYLANKLWQRPRDVSLAIAFFLRSMCMMSASRPCSPWRPASSRLSAWTKRGSGN